MRPEATPSWVIREDASFAVLLVLWLRESLGIASPAELPHLRGVDRVAAGRDVDAQDALERQWRAWWTMTLEPEAHPSPVPLQLVEEYGTWVALPVEGAAELAAAIRPLAEPALTWADWARTGYNRQHVTPRTADRYRAYAGTIAEHERAVGRRAHSFELNVEVLPLAERGIWWVGSLTIAVTDTLRADAAAFDTALHPIIAEIA